MNRRPLYTLIAIACNLLIISSLQAQTGHIEALKFNETVHNFGKIELNSGAHSCFFEYTNISQEPVVIYNILSSCGCTEPEWAKAPIMPGKSGKIKVTFKNDQGPYPFDKSLTIYTSASQKPILLRITGLVYEKGKSLDRQYPAHFGPLGMKTTIQNGGQVEQTLSTTKKENVVNLSKKPVTVGFTNISPGLSLTISPSTIPPQEAATITYTIDTKVKKQWGKTQFSASFVCNKEVVKEKFITECMIITRYSSLSYAESADVAQFQADKSAITFGRLRIGQTVKFSVKISNPGKAPLEIFKIETGDTPAIVKCPAKIGAGKSGTLLIALTPKKKESEAVYSITLITNAPERPLVTIFLAGDVL